MSVRYIEWAFRQNLKSPMQKLVLVKISDNADDSGLAFPSIEHIAKFTCASDSTVKRAIKEIESKGLMTIKKMPAAKNHKRNEYQLHYEVELHYEMQADESEGSSVTVTEVKCQSDQSQVSERPTNRHITANEPSVIINGSSDDKPPVKNPYSDDFEKAWSIYPKREGSNPKNKAWASWKARIKQGIGAQEMIDGTNRYGYYLQQKGQLNTVYVMQASRFFGPGCEFENAWQVTTTPNRGNSQPLDLDSKDWADDIGKIL